MPTQDRINELLVYKDGHLYWAKKTGSQAAGNLAGNYRPDGYVRVKVDKNCTWSTI